MKKKCVTGFLMLAVELVAGASAHSQGTLYLSNLDRPSAGSVAAGADSWLAQAFMTGDNPANGRQLGFVLNSIQLLMGAASGNSGAFSVSIYDGATRLEGPGNYIGSLNGPSPGSGGILTYVASDITLSPLNFYWIVITSNAPVGVGSYLWNLASTTSYNSSGGWAEVRPSYDSSTDGLVWTRTGSTPLQFAVNATAIPEPSCLALLGVYGLLLGARLLGRRRL